MKNAYPIILTPEGAGYLVTIPDFTVNTQGDSVAEAMEMARDAIGLLGIDLEDDGKALPAPSDLWDVDAGKKGVVTLVDVDFYKYRREHDRRAVRKNCTSPAWLCYKAEQAGLNFSQILQIGLKQALELTDPD